MIQSLVVLIWWPFRIAVKSSLSGISKFDSSDYALSLSMKIMSAGSLVRSLRISTGKKSFIFYTYALPPSCFIVLRCCSVGGERHEMGYFLSLRSILRMITFVPSYIRKIYWMFCSQLYLTLVLNVCTTIKGKVGIKAAQNRPSFHNKKN